VNRITYNFNNDLSNLAIQALLSNWAVACY